MAEKIMFPKGMKDAEAMAQTVLGTGNSVIEDAIDEMYRNEDLDALIAVLAQQVEDSEEVIVPVQFVDDDDNPLEFEDGEVPEGVGIKFCMLTDEDDNTWTPVFTNLDEVSELEGENVIPFELAEIIDVAMSEDGCSGVVVNPFGKSLSLENELLSAIMDTAMPLNEAFDMLREGVEAYDKGDMGTALRLYNDAARIITESLE